MSAHGLEYSIPILRRWAAHSDSPLPDNWEEFKAKNTTEAVLIEKNDPQLVSLIAGTASAGLRADALAGEISERPPVPEQVEKRAISAEIQDLYERRSELTFTEQMRLQQLDEKVWARAKREVEGENDKDSDMDVMRFRLEREKQRAENHAASMNQAMQSAKRGI